MAPPEPLVCGAEGCRYRTPDNCPNWDSLIKVMELHVKQAHPGPGQQVVGSSKQEKLPRPTLEAGISDADWSFFVSQWERYKRSTKILGQEAIDQLWACASEELSRQCHDAGVNKDTSEKDLLDMLRLCSIRAQNKLVNVVEFLNSSQNVEEPIAKFISRVRGQSKVCDFTVKCTKEGCDTVISYSDQLCAHVIVRGLEDPDIQERVLALAATEENLGLKKITEYVYAQETGARSRKLLSGESSLNKLSQYQQQQRGRSNTLPEKPELKQKCHYCGNSGHGYKSSVEVRKLKCPAFSKKCSNCNVLGHFSKQCKKEKQSEHGSLQDRGSVSDTGECDGFGFFSMTEPATRPRHKVRNIRKLSHHAVNEFGNWVTRRPEPQPSVSVSVSVCQDGYRQVEMPAPRNHRTITTTALPDTGAQMVVAGMDLVHKLGVTKKEMFPVSCRIKAANSEGLKLIGGLLITISATGPEGTIRNCSHMCYISENVNRFFLSKATCRDLGIISENFPEVGSADNLHSLNKCDLVDSEKPDSCNCPKRVQTPEPPENIPFPPTEENIPKLKEFILDWYGDSAFNCCEQQPLPLMKDSPPMKLFADKNAKPVAFHKPFPIPLHWQEAVKQQLDNDVKMGVLAKVPIGTPTEWCSRMVVLAKKDPTKPRRTVDFQHLNKICARQTHAGKSPFHQAVSVPANSWKSCFDAKDGYHSIPLHEEDQPLTTFITPWGKYHYKVLPQGFLASQDGYNSRYDEIIQGVENKERCVDDSILWDKFGAKSIEKHFLRACQYLSLCGKAGVLFSKKKFQFCQKEVEFIGFDIDEKGVKPTSDFLSAVRDFPVPTDITGVRSWFGLVEQCSYAFSKTDCMEHFRHLLRPDMTFQWTEELQAAFERSKAEIVHGVERGIETFDRNKKTCLIPDWSKVGVGFKLCQKNCDCETVSPLCCPDGWRLVFAGS